MGAMIALAVGVFAAGIVAGVIAVVTVAIRREERNLTLTSGPTDTVTQAGRWLNGVGVRAAATFQLGARTYAAPDTLVLDGRFTGSTDVPSQAHQP